MPSLRTAFLFATAALAAVCSAAPVDIAAANRVGSVAAREIANPDVTRISEGLVNYIASLHPRHNVQPSATATADNSTETPAPEEPQQQPQGLPDILTTAKVELGAVAEKIKTLTIAGDGLAAVGAVVGEFRDILGGTLQAVTALAGKPVETVLLLAGEVVEVPDVAQLVVDVLALVLGIVEAILKALGLDRIVLPLVQTIIAPLVTALLTTVLSLVDGLLPVVGPLLAPVLQGLSDVGLGGLTGILNL